MSAGLREDRKRIVDGFDQLGGPGGALRIGRDEAAALADPRPREVRADAQRQEGAVFELLDSRNDPTVRGAGRTHPPAVPGSPGQADLARAALHRRYSHGVCDQP